MLLISLLPTLAQSGHVSFDVEGTARTAWISAPAKSETKCPIVFYFHGHGGNGRNSMRTVAIRRHWPEALAVYPDGLPTKTPNDPEGRRPGWDMGGKENRDVKFFDVMLARLLKDYNADPKRIFVAGHSNGGGFSYFLWQNRSPLIAGFGPSAAAGARLATEPKPAFIIMGETDEIVDPARQRDSIATILKLNGAKEPGIKNGLITRYPGKVPTATYIHPGGHQLQTAAVPAMIAFFKQIGDAD